MDKILVPPIKCQGIKTKIIPLILENTSFNYSGKWIEPFMGSGVVGINVKPKNAIFNDINPHIINFYSAINEKKITADIVRTYLSQEGKNLESEGQAHYYKIRKRFNEEKNILDFLFLSRACFNGMIRFNRKGFFNVPFCKKPQRFSKAYITKIVNQVKQVYQILYFNKWIFTNKDFREIIGNATPNDLIYCDPPYFGRHVDYFNSWSEKDEYDLYICLKNTKARFILSTWYKNTFRENTSINNFWREFNIITKEHFYHIGGQVENRNSMLEALVMNFTPRPEPIKIKRNIEYEYDLFQAVGL